MSRPRGSVKRLVLGLTALAVLIFMGVYAFDELVAPKIMLEHVFLQSIRILIVVVFAVAAVIFVRRGRSALSGRINGQAIAFYEFLFMSLVLLLATFSILRIFNVDTNTLLLSGGIISITIGLIVSTFVGNILAGMLVFLLNLFKIGDVVLVNGIPAHVEEMSAFVTRFKNDAGGVLSIPNTAISSGSVMVTRFHEGHVTGSFGRLPYSKGDRVYTTYMNEEGVVVELDPIHTRIHLNSGKSVTFMNNSVLSGSVAVARVDVKDGHP